MQHPGFVPVPIMPFQPIYSHPMVHPPIGNNLTPLIPAIPPPPTLQFPPQIPHFTNTYGMASLSSLTILKPDHFTKTVRTRILKQNLYSIHSSYYSKITLPPELKENYIPTKFNYNFSAELENISQIAEEKRREETMKEIEEKKRKEKELKAQQEAWAAIQEKRNRLSTTPPRSSFKDPVSISMSFNIYSTEYFSRPQF